MGKSYSCPKGHCWTDDEMGSAEVDARSSCPVCGWSTVVESKPLELEPAPSAAAPSEFDAVIPRPTQLPTVVRDVVERLLPLDGYSKAIAPADAVEDQHVPGYEILSMLGHGGMGVVYLARQTRLNRLVALKMIAPGLLDQPGALARFQREAEAIAQLQHANIVQIYEVSQHAAQPFLTLEYVSGGSLAQRLAGEPITLRQAAELLETLAHAIDYAHRQGVVHRDLKPSNVLLTAEGTPKITDFGLAKQLSDASLETHSQAMVGTPAYMAPEQARGQAGPAADIYSLGACLYELLTGRPPFRAETPLETLRQATSDEPIAPSRLNRRLPRDLETICLKCLEKEPARRYGTAGELAEDVRRYLDGQTIRARPARILVRVGKWGRRHPAVAALLAVIVLATAGGVAGVWAHQHSLYMAWVRERELAGAAETARRGAEQRRLEAEANLDLFRESIDRYYTKISENELLNEEGLEPLRAELLESARDFYSTIVAQRDASPESEADLARAYWRLARLESEIAAAPQALKTLELALDIQQRLVGERPQDQELRRDLSQSLLLKGTLAKKLGHSKDAESWLNQSLQLSESLVHEYPEDARHPYELVVAMSQLGPVYRQRGEFERAEQLYCRILEIGEQLQRNHPGDSESQRAMAVAHNNLGTMYRSQGRLDEARQHLEKSLAIRQQLSSQYPEMVHYQRDLGLGYNNLGNLHQVTGDSEAAETAYQEALAIRSRLATSHPHMMAYQRDLANTLNVLGVVHHALRRMSEAEQELQRSVGLLESLVKKYPEVPEFAGACANSLHNLGILYESSGRWTESEAAFQRALEIDRQLVKAQPRAYPLQLDLIDNLISLGNLTTAAERPAEGTAWHAQALEQFGKLPDRRRPDRRRDDLLVRANAGNAAALTRLGSFPEALSAWQAALDADQNLQSRDGQTGEPRIVLQIGRATTLALAGEPAEAVGIVDRALESVEPSPSLLFSAACAYASASLVLSRQTKLAAEVRAQQSEHTAQQAIGCLQRALAFEAFRNSLRFRRLWEAHELDALRSRPDFPVLEQPAGR